MPVTHVGALWASLRLVAGIASALIFVIAADALTAVPAIPAWGPAHRSGSARNVAARPVGSPSRVRAALVRGAAPPLPHHLGPLPRRVHAVRQQGGP
ncbi:hypothetical protein [Nonomuraea jabiensis]|uniref:hypothetical protein n=1 Tax=Nonomuraea jabiensis TaxID=882448 RepID=UPI0036A82FD6